MDAHDLISKVKSLYADLGRIPTRREFESRVAGGNYQVTKLFHGSYDALLRAAGFETHDERRSAKPLGNEIFQKDISDAVIVHNERAIAPVYSPTVFIPDVHFPFAHAPSLERLYAFIEEFRPSRVIQLGDLYDMFAWSKFPKSMNVYMPKEEQELARSHAEAMWTKIRSLVPDAECVQMVGNHDIRPLRAVLAGLPSLEHVVEKYLYDLMTFDGVKTIVDSREEFIFEGVQVIHGYAQGMGKHRDHAMRNTVLGHQHKLHITFKSVGGASLWEMCCGHLGDAQSKAFSYTPQKTVDWHLGFGYLDKHGPRLIPL